MSTQRSSVIANESRKTLSHVEMCSYCGRRGQNGKDPDYRTWHMDHVVAISVGGPDSMNNIVKACAKCNNAKGTENWFPLPGTLCGDGTLWYKQEGEAEIGLLRRKLGYYMMRCEELEARQKQQEKTQQWQGQNNNIVRSALDIVAFLNQRAKYADPDEDRPDGFHDVVKRVFKPEIIEHWKRGWYGAPKSNTNENELS